MFALHQDKKLLTYSIVLAAALLLFALARKPVTLAQESTAYLRKVRAIYTVDFGISNPAGLAFSPKANALLVLQAPEGGQPGATNSNLVLITLYEDPAGSLNLAPFISIADPLNLAFDWQANSLLFFDKATNQLVEVKAGPTGQPELNQGLTRFEARQFGLKNPKGMALDPNSGRLFILDQAASQIVRVSPDPQKRFDGLTAESNGRIARIPLSPVQPFQPQGIAFNPKDGHLYVLGPSEKKLYELDEAGQPVSTRDVSALELSDVEGMLFAPSGDPTDDPSIMDLYLTDKGGSARPSPGQQPGRIVELSVTAPVLSASALAAPTVKASLVHTIDTSQWSPPSPDPAGITYIPSSKTLWISDSEVDEMPNLFTGKNLFEATTKGRLVDTFSTTAFSKEPSGAAVNTKNGHRFFSDDDKDKVFEVDLGPDGIYGTADDKVTSFSTRDFNDFDPEDVAFDSTKGRLFVTDGIGAEIYILTPGANKIFDGAPPSGDDRVTHFDTSSLGIPDCEGLEFNSGSGTLFIVDIDNRTSIFETTTDGALVRLINYSSAKPRSAADVAYAPGSSNPNVKNLYIVDRRVDNNTDPNENDGKVYELSLP
jgi:DNA-binding beta-propeller fold protein YncE